MVNGIYIFVCVFCAPNVLKAISELTFTAIPSSKIVSGQFLKLSCSVDGKQVPIVWMKDGEDIGNDCVLYGKYVDRTCSKVQDAFNLIFRAELSDQGIWSCSYGARMKKSIRIEVVVPALVYPLKVIPYGNPSNHIDNQVQPISLAASSSLQMNSGLRVVGTGTRQNPIDLTGRHSRSATEVLIQCRSTCASVQHHLQWKCANSVSIFESSAVSFPALVYPLKVIPYGNPSNHIDNQVQPISLAASSSLQMNSGLRVVGTGTRQNPIDLTGRHSRSATEVLIQCRSTCASVQHHLQWKCANSVSIFESSLCPVTDQGEVDLWVTQKEPGGWIALFYNMSALIDLNALQGLNRILCLPDHTTEQAFIDESTPNIPHYAFLMSSAGLPVNVTVSELQSNECSQTAYQRGACVYVMCPGELYAFFMTELKRVTFSLFCTLQSGDAFSQLTKLTSNTQYYKDSEYKHEPSPV
ncbi:hypothetical protein AHF37_01015 [Paragonimus kellicotti]|nr:hypothetical protein AHF37_01015 [Paragonimus kellicotti]